MTINEWLQESKNLLGYLEKEGMNSDIGMPFTQMIRLIKAAQNYIQMQKNLGKGEHKIELLDPMINTHLKATIEYLDSKEEENEHK